MPVFVVFFAVLLMIPRVSKLCKLKKEGDTELNIRNAEEIRTRDLHTMSVNAVLVSSAAYVGSLGAFLLGTFVPNLPDIPIGCILPSKNDSFREWKNAQSILIALYGLHFCRRTFEVFFVHKYARSQTVLDAVGAQVYYWAFAFWIGWSIRPDAGYENTYLTLFIIGVIMFCLGEIGNCAAHLQLRKLRSSRLQTESGDSIGTRGHVIPRGVLFSYVSCPHYSFEILTWLGFLLATWVIASIIFFLATSITLLVYSTKHHQRYKNDFDGEHGRELYPPQRKALIPFIY
ncbi:very-long-chain enoyl-CoA reductase-like [Amphiura filiformis]|uniref:very-long-chain enoyl-CoA reductase-like n=1 Tax=Amphiura filiformis TaxID=82378 RepID=UPI003B21030E